MIWLFTVFLANPVLASESEKEVAGWVNKNQCQMNSYLDEANNIKNDAEFKISTFFAEANKEQALTCSKSSMQESSEDKNINSKSVLVFVSLSMPRESLKSLFSEAEKNNSGLIIRGLKNNSFKETAAAFQDLGISVQIDPNLFEKYEIKEVPTFVAVKEKEPFKIKGNVSLSYAQKKFEEES